MTMYSPLRHISSVFLKRRPIQLTYFVTRKCNAGCPWCFYLKSTGGIGDAGEGGNLSLDEVGKVSRSLGRLLWVAFSGGEVFLHDELVETVAIFHDRNRPPVMLLPTNGMLGEAIFDRTERILRRCPKSVIAVKVSIDGLDGDHDALRDTPGSFDKAMETYRLLGRLLDRYPNFELGINTVFCSQNQDKMDQIIDFVAGLETRGTHTISMIRGNLLEEGYKEIDVEKYRKAIDRLQQNLRNRSSAIHRFAGARLKAAQDIVQRRLIHRTRLAGRRLIPCYSGVLSLVLTETGEVYPCEILKTGFGNVRDHDYDLERLLASDRARKVLEPIAQGACHCTHECNFIMNILFNPRLYPALAGEYLNLGGIRHGPGAPTPSCPSKAKKGYGSP
ncbi:MAG: radical SAM protein [Rhodospirillales bacterium]